MYGRKQNFCDKTSIEYQYKRIENFSKRSKYFVVLCMRSERTKLKLPYAMLICVHFNQLKVVVFIVVFQS